MLGFSSSSILSNVSLNRSLEEEQHYSFSKKECLAVQLGQTKLSKHSFGLKKHIKKKTYEVLAAAALKPAGYVKRLMTSQ